MKLRFIQILILIVTLNSCRQIDEIIDSEKTSKEIIFDNAETNERENYNGQASRKDSASSVGFEIDDNDPPVKHGGHWRTKN